MGGAPGALWGALTAGIAYGIGQAFMMEGMQRVFGGFIEEARALAHGISGGALAEAQGGSFQAGFLASTFSQYANYRMGDGRPLRNTISAAIVGGTASKIGGGRFQNGAVTAAFQTMFNEMVTRAHGRDKVRIEQRTEIRETATYAEHIEIEIRSFNGNLEASRDLYKSFKQLSDAGDILTVADVLIRGPRPDTLYGFSLAKAGDVIAATFVAFSDKWNTYYPYSVTVHYRLDMIMHTGRTFVLYERSYRVPSPYSSPKDHHYGLKAALRASQRGVEYHRRQTGSTWND